MHKAIGSIDVAAVVRSVLFVGADPDFLHGGEDFHKRCVVVHAKSNLAPSGRSFAFELQRDAFTWGAYTETTAEELTSLDPDDLSARRSQIREAVDFLREQLANGCADRAFLIAEGQRLRLKERTLDRAATQLGVQKETVRDANGRVMGATWSLPPKDDAYQEQTA